MTARRRIGAAMAEQVDASRARPARAPDPNAVNVTQAHRSASASASAFAAYRARHASAFAR